VDFVMVNGCRNDTLKYLKYPQAAQYKQKWLSDVSRIEDIRYPKQITINLSYEDLDDH